MALFSKLRAALSLVALSLVSTGTWAESKFNLTPGVTDISQDVYDLHMKVVWVMAVIGIIVFGLMFYSMIAHRKSKNPTPATFSHNTLIEIIWTTIPFLILIALAVPAVKILVAQEDASESDMTIVVTGYQWKWHYQYLEDDIGFFSNLSTPREQYENFEGDVAKGENYLLEVDNPLVIPVGKKIRFAVTADDVIHSWAVPAFAVKKDAIPGFINETHTTVQVDKPGTYRGQCSELCGKDHGFMPIVVIAKEQAEFDAWMTEQKAAKEEAARLAAEAAAKSWSKDDLMAEGEKVYNRACAACHKADGSGTPPTFPALKGSDMAINADRVTDHIEIVVNGKAGTMMQAFGSQLTDAELAAVITYERNAWGNDTDELVQPADISAFKAGQ